MADEQPSPLDYARPIARPTRPRKPLIPPNQSAAGIGAFILSLITLLVTMGFLLSVASGEGYGALFSMCAGVPISIFAGLFGLLGMTEEGRNGYRDRTLAKWALWITGACWLVGGVVTLAAITHRR